VEYAIELLRADSGTKKNVMEIGQEAGFSSQSTFYSIFKKSTGATPAKYRKQLQAEHELNKPA
jgi:AraC-like DNA-binding protein